MFANTSRASESVCAAAGLAEFIPCLQGLVCLARIARYAKHYSLFSNFVRPFMGFTLSRFLLACALSLQLR